MRQHFTGYEHDAESGLDYAHARYYGSAQGRFTSPDPILSSGKPAIPQSWNYYTYCLNNPLIITDPNGLIWGYYNDKDGNGHYHWHEDEKALNAAGATVVANFIYQSTNGNFISLNPNANEWTSSSTEWNAKRALWGYTGLASSWQDWMPFWGPTRRFLFNYTVGNYEHALVNFANASADGGTAIAGSLTIARTAIQKAFATSLDEAIFYSGEGSYQAAKTIATNEGGKMIGDTTGGQVLEKVTSKLPDRFSDVIWKWGSKQFANESSGFVRTVIRQPLRDRSTWELVEQPILKAKPNVTMVPR